MQNDRSPVTVFVSWQGYLSITVSLVLGLSLSEEFSAVYRCHPLKLGGVCLCYGNSGW